jgi:hypothetical protein
MANKFGEAALIAARLEVPSQVTPAQRWETAVRQLYPDKPYMQKKSAPKAAFLGLCEAGLVKGIATGETTPQSRNKEYAVKSIELLRGGTHRTVLSLWTAVSEGDEAPHAAQMDVVLALWKNGLIVAG